MGEPVSRPRLLDLFCGAGGCSAGYHRAGFDVVGVDLDPLALANYPYPCLRADAMDVLAGKPIDDGGLIPPARGVELARDGTLDLDTFDVIHASPPCQDYSITRHSHDHEYPRLVEPLLEWFNSSTWPGVWVIENVVGAPLPDPVLLCGSEWPLAARDVDGRELRLRRHRLFSSNIPLTRYGVCGCVEDRRLNRIGGVYGGGSYDRAHDNPRPGRGGYTPDLRIRAALLGIEWFMTGDQLAEAIPPAYTEHLGRQILDHLQRRDVA
jgi:DNA (cytosine-5)-methyltransferase 1